MGGHGDHKLLFPTSAKVIGFAIPICFVSVFLWLKWDAYKYSSVPHDIQHKPWLYYSGRNKDGEHSGGHH